MDRGKKDRKTSTGKLVRLRGRLVFGILFIGYLGAVLRLYHVQIIQGDRLKKRALAQYLGRKGIRSIRGTIYDCNLKELALSVDMDSVYMNPPQVKGKLDEVAGILDVSVKKLMKKAASRKAFAWIKRKVTPDQAEKLKKLAAKGIYMLPEGKRFYPRKELAGHLIGFAGLDNRGLEGVELAYERYLAKAGGLRGNDVKLTIDEKIQFIADKALAETCVKYRAGGGQALVMDPSTGRVLAMAIYPRFDPNRFRAVTAARWRNRCLTDGFEPGSILKVFLAAAALEEDLFSPTQRIFCEEGAIKLKQNTIRDWKPYGWLEFREVIEKSSNVGAVKVGLKLGKQRYYDYLTRFGFGKKTGIGLPGESSGILKDLAYWTADSVAYHSIGQGILVTSMQTLRAFCAVANGGMLPDARIIEEIWDPETGASVDFAGDFRKKRVLSARTCRTLADILQKTVQQGTAKKAAIDGYTVAGKTGTAQKFDVAAGKYFEDRYVASFIGFSPVSAPRIAVLVMVDEPKGLYSGGEVAAPTFARIARGTLRYLQVPPDKEEVRDTRYEVRGTENRRRIKPETRNPKLGTRKVAYKVMPGLKGKSMRQVMKELSGSGLTVKLEGSGFAVAQTPSVGGVIPPDRICTVQFSPPVP